MPSLEHLIVRRKPVIKEIILHCSDTPDGREHTAEDIHRWHKEKGWDGIGYHHVIRIDGKIESGRPEYWTGAHAGGHNSDSIGICLIGRGDFSEKQWASLKVLVREKMQEHKIARVIGHSEISYKPCPNFDVQQWLEDNGLKRGML
ncbi:MAG TPA: N-acetylmuramoyl-L-alanine amidase [Methylococcaceae bacterium]|nr:N-acetylmuramoyl-L-alanine amidase [Methylococcaceae bacterium]